METANPKGCDDFECLVLCDDALWGEPLIVKVDGVERRAFSVVIDSKIIKELACFKETTTQRHKRRAVPFIQLRAPQGGVQDRRYVSALHSCPILVSLPHLFAGKRSLLITRFQSSRPEAPD